MKLSTYKTIRKSENAAYVLTGNQDLKSLKNLSSHKSVVERKVNEKQNHLLTFYDRKIVTFVNHVKADARNRTYALEDFRVQGAHLRKAVQKEKITDLQLQFAPSIDKEQIIAYLEGFELAGYHFSKYKSKRAKSLTAFRTLSIQNSILSTAEIRELQHVMKAVSLTKDIVNEPVITLNATALSEAAVQAGKDHGFTTKVLNKKQIQALNMGGLLGVNMGSDDPPTFSILEYKPANAVNKKPIVFVGKGVVYDTGGNSLKIGGVMLTMKCDMAGAAAVIGSLSAIASNKLPVHVVGLIPATDNRIGHNALVPDDVITMHDGTTVEIQNTDAEGRLILGDALSYAKQYDPELVIDLATLTGAASIVTGFYGMALMGNESHYSHVLKQVGENVYERCAELPMWREYEALIKSDIADIKNIGGPVGGTITAAKFLEHFTKYNWIHLDIAGPAYIKDGARDYHHKGGTGVGVRLLYHFTKKFIEENQA